MPHSPPSGTQRWRLLRRVRPSYLILLFAVPLTVYLFVTVDDYRAAFTFIAPGLWTTVQVTVIAYLLAAVLGLGLAGLLLLRSGRMTLSVFLILALLLAGAGVYYLTRPQVDYLLVGQPDGLVAIIQGTPQARSETIQRGRYVQGAEPRNIRSVVDVEGALQRLESGVVGAAFLPAASAPPGAPVLWETSFLPPSAKGPGLALAVFSGIVLMLTFAGWQSGNHPLAIFAELYVDMIRGIPMLVIILYIGFPIQGAVRDFSGGFLEPSRLSRGIIAIGLGYAAYMAEIFRAGIQAVGRGQKEAARSLGLSGWQTARYIVLPQALRIVIPPLGNEFIAMLKDTSLLSLLSLREITQRTREFAADTFEYFPAFNSVALLYIGLTLAASSLLKSVERRAGRSSH
ncbi:MAG: amino acid ABC transporter permease [Trueperaceae bacterium]